jgi:hypothetical protein
MPVSASGGDQRGLGLRLAATKLPAARFQPSELTGGILSDPTPATIKRLFATSGNQCAFPNCRNSLVEGTKVTGRICHIKGRRPGAARYDPEQPDEQRRAFDNLLLMCPIHHDVIDADPESYTVARLAEIKSAHEIGHAAGPEPSDAITSRLLQMIGGNATVHGSVILSHQHMGGQVAHAITNVGPQPRRLSEATATAIVERLRQLPPIDASVCPVMGDGESYRFASQLKGVLEAAGWTVEGVHQAIFEPIPEGVYLRMPSRHPSMQALGDALVKSGIKARGFANPIHERVEINVGSSI